MPDYKWERVKDDDPERCKTIMKNGEQCHNRSLPHSEYCAGHGGNKGEEKAERERLRNYRLSKFRSRLSELGNSDQLTSLKDEVAILRLLIEERINQATDTKDLILISGPLSDLILKLERVLTSCNRLDSKLGNLLDRTKVLQFAQTIIEIISRNIDDEDIINKIGDEIFTSLGDL